MLSSKYAPIVALTILGVIVIVVLGYFLAIKPQLDEASEIRAQTDEVVQNTLQVEQESARIDQYEAELNALEPISDVLSLNAPASFDRDVIAERITSAIDESGLEFSNRVQAPTEYIDGWEAPPGVLVSNNVAALFTRAPVQDDATTPYEPVVSPMAQAGPVAENLAGVAVSLIVVGTVDEGLDFLDIVTSPDEQLFQLYSLDYQARGAGDGSLAGVSDAEDGDVIMTITGYFYLLDPDLTVVDDGELQPVGPPAESPFILPEDAPEQPGAN